MKNKTFKIVFTQDLKNGNTNFGVNSFINDFKNQIKSTPGLKLSIINKKNFFTGCKAILNSDLVHINGCWSSIHFLSFVLAKIYNKKIIFSPHGMLSKSSLDIKKVKKKIAWFFYQKLILDLSNLVIVNSKKEYREVKNKTSSKIIIIPHGIKLEKIPYKKKRKKIKFIFFSRIHPIKGLLELVKIWDNSMILKEYQLDIYGKIEDRQYFKKIKIYLKNNKNINFFGYIKGNQKFKILKSYDVLLATSKTENFGYTILESLATGLYVIYRKGLPWEHLSKMYASPVDMNEKSITKNIVKVLKIFKKKRNTKKLEIFLKKNYDIKLIIKRYINNYKITN